MRELKFRAWDEENEYMTYSSEDCWSFDEFGGMWLVAKRIGYLNSNTHVPFEVKHMPVMQYTGLPDRHGQETYEGDVLREDFDDGEHLDDVIVWKDGAFRINWGGALYCLSERIHLLRKVGNIHENPELVEEKEG